MKWANALLISIMLTEGSLLAADFDPPRNAFSGADIKAAMAKAEEDQRAILLMYYDYTKGDPYWMRRSMEVLEALDSTCIVVYVDNTENKLLTKSARSELSGKKLGSTYPRAVVMDTKLSKLIYPITQSDWSDNFDTTIRDAKREAQSYRLDLRRHDKKQEAKAAEAAIVPAPIERVWTDTQGRTLKGTLNYIESDSINVTRDTGLSATIRLESLSEQDHIYLETYSDTLFDKSGML
jgi:hypothetical protein